MGTITGTAITAMTTDSHRCWDDSFGHMAQPGFVDPYWAPIKVQPAGLDRFDVVDDPSRPLPPGHTARWGNNGTYTRWFEVCSQPLGRHDVHDDPATGPRVERAAEVSASSPLGAAAHVVPLAPRGRAKATAFNFSGSFSGHYPSKDCLDVVTIASAGSPQLNATKVTGTDAVPAGQVTFYFDVNTLLG